MRLCPQEALHEAVFRLESLSASREGVDGAPSQGHAAGPAYGADGVPGLCKEEDDDDEEARQLQTEFGQLAVGDGRSQYMVDGAASILQDLVEEEEEEEESPQHQGDQQLTSILGLGPCYADLGQLHPTPEKFATYWRLYKENRYPIIRILHMPTVEPIGRYKAGMMLQAFAMFLSSLRSYCNLRLMWSLTSQDMYLHRDGTHFGLSAFTAETRRRLWWTICRKEYKGV
ncbi:hypothetical protein J3458_015612 [Metarhizium acridum]|uniref:uncharacterized protein n=1 Tax=Metarhizium acridum TaxID=92637 RepID=UPI001C6BDC4C|nr:hypothetical protein J3458_015612 [Metarhizium acridum]